MRINLFMLITCIFLWSCNNSKQEAETKNDLKFESTRYARHFRIVNNKNYTLIHIKNPWVDAQNIQYRYAIKHKKTANIPKDAELIPAQPEKVAAISTTHIAFLETINELNHLKAVSDKKYIYSKAFQKLDSIYTIQEVGFDTNLNIERLLQLGVKVVFLYGINNNIEPLRKRLLRANIVPVMIGEYMEQHPLGKAEWIKVFGAIYNKNNEAARYFDSVASAYERLKKSTRSVKKHPTVFTGLPWNETWHTPGGNTYTAKLINDAGGKYIFGKDTTSINYQYDTEIVYERAGNANYWINPGTAYTMKNISGADPRMKLFDAYQNKNIYNNNKRSLQGGGSDYMESGVVKPHLILKDLIHIFHSDLFPKHQLFYYQKVK